MQYPPPPAPTSDPTTIFTNQVVQNFFLNPPNGGSHIIDGVVHFVVRAYDTNGIWIPNGYSFISTNAFKQTMLFRLVGGEGGMAMYSNMVPASVELQLGILEDRPLQHAGSLPTAALRTPYLQQQSGRVHLFRQLVTIPNVDPTAYQ